MKKLSEVIKDFLYDAMDLIIILVIIVSVIGVIGWRLDILFAKDLDKIPIASNEEPGAYETEDSADTKDGITSNPEDDEGSLDSDTSDGNEDTSEDTADNNDQLEDSSDVDDSNQSSETIVVKIPVGTLPPSIANILIENGLIQDKSAFLAKAQELKLDTRLQSGSFKIKENSSIEAIIKTIARVK